MVNSKQLFLLGFLILSISLVQGQELISVHPETEGMSIERLNRLNATMQEYISEGKLPGAALIVCRNGKIVYNEAFGYTHIDNNIPMSNQSIFRIASQTKALISVGIMMLQEEGKLLISDPLSKYIPEFKNSTVAIPSDTSEYSIVQANREITLRDLLTHTAGIGYGYGLGQELWQAADIQGWYFAHRDEPILATIKRMATLPNEAHPGERYVYGYNTDILGAVIELVSGQDLNSFISERLLSPLKMDDTHFYLPQEKSQRLTTVYSTSENGLVVAPDPGGMVGQGAYVNGPRKSYSGGAGLVSTTEDYATFLQMLLNKGTYNGHRFLSRKSVELMTVNHLGDIVFPWASGTGFGLGFSINEDLGARGSLGTVGEFGWGGAYHSTYWVDPEEELIVVYLTQVIPADNLDDHGKIRALIYQAIID